MDHHSLQLPGPDGPVPADEALPRGPVHGAVIVLQEAFGVNDHIVDVCERFAAVGYRAVAPHLFHRDGVNALPYDIEVALPHMANLTADGIRADIAAVREHLASHGLPLSLTGIVGFCMGGSITCAIAAEDAYGAAVTFYGSGMHKGRFGFRSLGCLSRRPQRPLWSHVSPVPPQSAVSLSHRLPLPAGGGAHRSRGQNTF